MLTLLAVEVEANYAGMTAYYWTLVLGQVGAALAATTSRRRRPNRTGKVHTSVNKLKTICLDKHIVCCCFQWKDKFAQINVAAQGRRPCPSRSPTGGSRPASSSRSSWPS